MTFDYVSGFLYSLFQEACVKQDVILGFKTPWMLQTGIAVFPGFIGGSRHQAG